MNRIFIIAVFLGIGFSAYSQFTIIPTGTTTGITDLVKQGDTIIISGKNNFFAKSYDFGNTLITLSPPGPSGYTNFDFQIKNNSYYILSVEGFPYDHNYILKSIDFGVTWQPLYDTIGLFSTMSIIDSTCGIIGGGYGAYALTQGTDSIWLLDSLYSTILATESYDDSTILMLSLGSFAYMSDNRGLTWNWISGIPTNTYEDIQFINRDTIYVISHQGSGNPQSFFTYSFTGGLSWNTITLQPNPSDTTNYGTYFDTRIYDFYFNTPNHGYIVGYNYDLNESVIFETNDYGQNWTVFHTGFTDAFYSLLFIDDSTAFVGGANGLLLKWNPLLPLQPVGILENRPLGVSFGIYPNPSNDHISVDFSSNHIIDELYITNVIGCKIISMENVTDKLTISTTDLQNGIYFISARSGSLLSTKKLIIQH